MIIQKYRGQLLLVTQPDHGDLAGQFAAHWGNSQFQRPEPYEDMVVAATAHDNGWWEQDNRPTIDSEKQSPYDFRSLPYTEHTTLYRRGINRAIDDSPYAGLMVCMHGTGLYKQRYGTDPSLVRQPNNPEEAAAVEKFIQDQELIQQEIRSQFARDARYRHYLPDAYIWMNYKLLQVWDRLSLMLCWRGASEFALSPAPTSYSDPETNLAIKPVSEHELTVSPYPFRESPIEFHVLGRLLPDLPYENARVFKESYYRAPRIDLAFILRRV